MAEATAAMQIVGLVVACVLAGALMPVLFGLTILIWRDVNRHG